MEILSAIIQLLGGLAMFLYGMELMGDGLKNSSGDALKRVLEKVTSNVVLGVLTGALVTAVIQSSTATIVLSVALIGAGVLNLKQAVSIVMGANIGTTVTAQLIRLGSIESNGSWLLWLFDTDTLAPLALIAGILFVMFIKTKTSKPLGDIFMGFGILFIGLNLMTAAVHPLSETAAFRSILMSLSNPIWGIFVGLVLTVIVQSSSATVGMLQAIAVTGTLNFATVYPVIMGINLGTCVITAFYCTVGAGNSGKDAQRTGFVHIAFNTIGTVLFLVVMNILQSRNVFGTAFWHHPVDSGGIANFQTVFNLLTAIVLIPFNGQLVKLAMVVIREDKVNPHNHPELYTLNENLYISPAVAVGEATKAVSSMGRIAADNFMRCCNTLVTKDKAQMAQIELDEDNLDRFADRADNFLIGLSKVVENEADDRQVDVLMQTVHSFERVGDYGINLVELTERLEKENVDFSGLAKRELLLLCQAVKEIMDITLDAFDRNDNEAAKKIEPLEETIDDMVRILRDRHTKRLKAGTCSIPSGLVFMEALTNLERAADHCSSIAVMMLARTNEAILNNHYEYLRVIHSGNDAAYREERNRRREQYILPLKDKH